MNEQEKSTPPVVDSAEEAAKQIWDNLKQEGFTSPQIIRITQLLRNNVRQEVDANIKSLQEFSASI